MNLRFSGLIREPLLLFNNNVNPGPPYSELMQESCDIRCSHSDGFPDLIQKLQASLLVSTYQTGHLVVVLARNRKLSITFNQFQRAMGIGVKAGTIAVRTPGSVVPAECAGHRHEVAGRRKA
jgi:hypothetical protein